MGRSQPKQPCSCKLIETSKWATEKSFIPDSFTPGAIFKRVTRLKIAPGVLLSAIKLFPAAHVEVGLVALVKGDGARSPESCFSQAIQRLRAFRSTPCQPHTLARPSAVV